MEDGIQPQALELSQRYEAKNSSHSLSVCFLSLSPLSVSLALYVPYYFYVCLSVFLSMWLSNFISSHSHYLSPPLSLSQSLCLYAFFIARFSFKFTLDKYQSTCQELQPSTFLYDVSRYCSLYCYHFLFSLLPTLLSFTFISSLDTSKMIHIIFFLRK